MSSAVYTLENHDKKQWGLYGSLVMAAANFGTLLGSFAAWSLRAFLTDKQLYQWGWRVPFLSGILVSLSGFYLRTVDGDEKGGGANSGAVAPSNPIKLAFARENLRSLLAAAMVPMLWSSGFYLSFVWMAIYMADLIENPVPGSFGVNATALFFSVCLLFPLAGIASDRLGRRLVMTVGGLSLGIMCPFLVSLIGRGNPGLALASQILIGISLSCFGAPMVAWLVESFEPAARLTSVAVGYNLAQATIGGLTPALATFLVDSVGPTAPGYIITALAAISLTGLWVVKPTLPRDAVTGFAEDSTAQTPITNGGPQLVTRRRKKEVFSAVPTGNNEEGNVSSDDDI